MIPVCRISRLEDALEEIKLLQGRLARREETLQNIRKKNAADQLRYKLSMNEDNDGRRSNLQDEKANELKIIDLQDEISDRISEINDNRKEIDRLKYLLHAERQKHIDKAKLYEKQFYGLHDHVARLEIDKKNLSAQLSTKDSNIEKLIKERDELQQMLENNPQQRELQQRHDDLFQRLVQATTTIQDQEQTMAELNRTITMLEDSISRDRDYEAMQSK